MNKIVLALKKSGGFMKENIKIKFLIIFIIFFLYGCAGTLKPVTEYIDSDMIKSGKHIEKIDEYDSPYTMCYKNSDGTYTVYMFSSPVSFKNKKGRFEYVDNKITHIKDSKMKKEGYKYQNAKNNIKVLFPEDESKDMVIKNDENIVKYSLVKNESDKICSANLTESENMFGDLLPNVCYGDESENICIKNYVTKAGVKSEIVLNKYPGIDEIKFKVKIPDSTIENKNNGYISFRDENGIFATLYGGIQKDSYTENYEEKDGHISIKNNVNIKKEIDSDLYTVTFKLDNEFLLNENIVYPVRFDTSLEFNLSCQPDSQVYSRNPFANAYLNPVSFIGNNSYFGEGENYIRFRFDYFFNCNADAVISSFYRLKELTGFSSDKNISLNQVNDQWTSTDLNWFNKAGFEKEIANKNVNNGKNHTTDISFDITEYTKKCFADSSWMTESYGLVLKGIYIKENREYAKIYIKDIIYLTSNARKIKIFTQKSVYSKYGKIIVFDIILSKYGFIRTHALSFSLFLLSVYYLNQWEKVQFLHESNNK